MNRQGFVWLPVVIMVAMVGLMVPVARYVVSNRGETPSIFRLDGRLGLDRETQNKIDESDKRDKARKADADRLQGLADLYQGKDDVVSDEVEENLPEEIVEFREEYKENQKEEVEENQDGDEDELSAETQRWQGLADLYQGGEISEVVEEHLTDEVKEYRDEYVDKQEEDQLGEEINTHIEVDDVLITPTQAQIDAKYDEDLCVAAKGYWDGLNCDGYGSISTIKDDFYIYCPQGWVLGLNCSGSDYKGGGNISAIDTVVYTEGADCENGQGYYNQDTGQCFPVEYYSDKNDKTWCGAEMGDGYNWGHWVAGEGCEPPTPILDLVGDFFDIVIDSIVPEPVQVAVGVIVSSLNQKLDDSYQSQKGVGIVMDHLGDFRNWGCGPSVTYAVLSAFVEDFNVPLKEFVNTYYQSSKGSDGLTNMAKNLINMEAYGVHSEIVADGKGDPVETESAVKDYVGEGGNSLWLATTIVEPSGKKVPHHTLVVGVRTNDDGTEELIVNDPLYGKGIVYSDLGLSIQWPGTEAALIQPFEDQADIVDPVEGGEI